MEPSERMGQPRSLEAPCRRCGDARAWILRPVREVDGVMPVELDGDARLGWYEAAICIGCGWTQFWARDYEPTRAPSPMAPCLDCGVERGWLVAESPDLLSDERATRIAVKLAPLRFKASLIFGGRGWVGTLAVRICAACAAAAWLCRPEERFAEDLDSPSPSPRACRRCQGEQTLTEIADDSELTNGPVDRAVVAEETHSWLGHGVRREGRFEIDVCRTCFAVEWQALDLDQLHEQRDKGVFRLDRESSGGDGGPYR